MIRYYDRAGQPITREAWVALMEDPDYRTIAKTEVGDVLVSTVWIGLDHFSSGSGPPLVLETMCFGGPEDQVPYRWATEKQARAGHRAMVSQMREVSRDR